MEGYIPISRKIFNHPFWKEERVYSFFEAWLDMIRTAKYNAETVLVKGRCLSIPRGDLVASVRYLANRWNWHRGRVERFLKMLKEQDMIKTRTETGISIISILNYDTYNRTGDPNETAIGTDARQSRDSDRTKINKVNKENKGKKVAVRKEKPSSKGEVEDYCIEIGLPKSDGSAVWDKWNGNGFTNGGKAMKDWKAVIRSWKGYGYMPSQKNPQSNHVKHKQPALAG